MKASNVKIAKMKNQYTHQVFIEAMKHHAIKFVNDGFKPIPGFPNYFVSESGEIASAYSGKIRKQSTDGNGYKKVLLKVDGKQRFELVHRLVAITFLGFPVGDRCTVNHKDGNKSNNHVSNLEWCTYQYNELDKRKRLNTDFRGTSNPNSKFTVEQAQEIRKRLASLPFRSKVRSIEMMKIRSEYGISQTSIRMILIGERLL